MIYRFSGYELDDETGELRRGATRRRLSPKGVELLSYLLDHSTRVVPKEELFAEVWGGETVTASVLPVTIRTIRAALNESGSGTVLRTIRGRGYRIGGGVERHELRVSDGGGQAGFVGRRVLLGELRDEFMRAVEAASRMRCVRISGEAGVGKTRLMEEFAAWLQRRGAVVLQVRCPDDSGAPPFWPIQELLRQGSRAYRAQTWVERTHALGLDLDQAEERMRQLFDAGSGRALEPAVQRAQLADTLTRLIAQASRVAPLVLLFDDLQCADEETLRVFESVGRDLEDCAVFVMVTYRNRAEARHRERLERALDRLAGLRGSREVHLPGLDLEDIESLIRFETGIEPAAGWALALQERTGGNPFFLREMLRFLVGQEQLAPDLPLAEIGLPLGVREAVGQRVATLSRDCAAVVTWASVIGRQMHVPLLERVAGFSPERLREVLVEATEAQLLMAPANDSADGSGRRASIAFVHDLIRETVYEALSGPERVLRHRAVAEALEAGAEPRSDRVFELARHFFEAAPGGDVDRAVDACLNAARQASDRYAYDAALGYLDQALRAEELRHKRDELRYCCLQLSRAGALWKAGRYQAAQAEYERSIDAARRLQRFDLLGFGVLGLVGWPRFDRLRIGSREPEAELDRLEAWAREALDGLRDADSALRSRLVGVLVQVGQQRSPPRVKIGLEKQALSLARESRDRKAIFHALLAKLSALTDPSETERALALADEAVSLAEHLREPIFEFLALELRIPHLMALGAMGRADRDLQAADRIAEFMRVPAYSYAVGRFHLARALGDGHLERARELLPLVLELGGQAEDPGFRSAAAMLEFWMLAVEGGAEEALRVLHTSMDLGWFEPGEPPRDAATAALSAYFSMLAGDRVGAARHFERAAVQEFSEIHVSGSWLWNLGTCAEVCVYLHDIKRGEELYQLLAPFERLNVMVTNSLYCYRGSAALPLGRLSLLTGQRSRAQQHFEAALDFNRAIGAVPSVVWTQLAYARFLSEGTPGERAWAREMFGEADRLAKSLGLELRGIGVG